MSSNLGVKISRDQPAVNRSQGESLTPRRSVAKILSFSQLKPLLHASATTPGDMMRSVIVAITLSIFLLPSVVTAQVAARRPNAATPQDVAASRGASESTSQAPSGADDCLIVFFRPMRFVGSALKPSVYVDGQQIARLDNGRYFSLRVSSGKHQITSSMKQSLLDLELKPDEPVYLEMAILPGTWRGGGRMIPSAESVAIATIAKLKPLDKASILEQRVGFDLKLEHEAAAAKEEPFAPLLPPPPPPDSSATEQQAVPLGAVLEIGSNPSGADIVLDDIFYGNSPSSIGVPPGDYTIRVLKSGYKAWERKVRVSSGRISIAAELEISDPPRR
jgi:hypothetical protein